MQKKKPQAETPEAPSNLANSPLSHAVSATMPLVYSASIAQSQISSGPLPAPSVLRQYEELQPGIAARIIKMAEDEAEHRRASESSIIAIQGRDQIAYRRSELLGQAFGLLIGIAAITGAVICAMHGAQLAGAFIGTAGVTGLVTAFILGRTLLMKQMQIEFKQQQAATETQLKASADAKSTPKQ